MKTRVENSNFLLVALALKLGMSFESHLNFGQETTVRKSAQKILAEKERGEKWMLQSRKVKIA